jgi:hypothetical protein
MIASPASVPFNKFDCIPRLSINIRKIEGHILCLSEKCLTFVHKSVPVKNNKLLKTTKPHKEINVINKLIDFSNQKHVEKSSRVILLDLSYYKFIDKLE